MEVSTPHVASTSQNRGIPSERSRDVVMAEGSSSPHEGGSPPRRSGRKRKRNSKYRDGSFLALEDIPVSDEELLQLAYVSSEEEFDLEAEEQASAGEDELSEGEGSDANASDEDDGAPGEEPMSDIEPDPIDIEILSPAPKALGNLKLSHKNQPKKRSGPKPRPLEMDEVHSRGVKKIHKHIGRDFQLFESYGNHPEDVEVIVKVREKWFDEVTLPSRHADSRGVGGLAHSFWVSDDKRHLDATEGWEWYRALGGDMRRLQTQNVLNVEESKRYTADTVSHSPFVMGPIADQKLFDPEPGSCILLHEGWSKPVTNGATHAQTSASDNDRRGCIINAGAPVHCLDWIPNQNGCHQYLAMSTNSKIKDTFENTTNFSKPTDTTPAYRAAKPSASTIQIWEFTASEHDEVSTIDVTYKPRLRVVLCFDWGHIRQFKWCPSLHERGSTAGSLLDFGLLALITADGKLRVLDIKIPTPATAADENEPIYIHITTVSFESQPPDTITTCLAWLTTSMIAAGCANGYVAVWDIAEHLQSAAFQSCSLTSKPTTTTPNALPTFYQPLHHTYITNIVSCGPSQPHLITTTSPDGFHRLTSLLHPHTDNVQTLRSRILSTPPIWHDHTQHVFSADDQYALKAYSLRTLHTSTVMTYEEAGVTALTASPVHTALLLGRADGKVTVYNPVRRLMQKRMFGEHYRQVWWAGEWRRGLGVDESTGQKANGAAVGESKAAEGGLTNPAEMVSHDTQQDDSSAASQAQAGAQEPQPSADNSALRDGGVDLTAAVSNGVQQDDRTTPPQAQTGAQEPPSTTTSTTPKPYRGPLSRLLTGYTAQTLLESATLTSRTPKSTSTSKSKSKSKANKKSNNAARAQSRTSSTGVIIATVYEEKTGVRAVAWNGNLKAGTWAAAGWGSGLVVVEDVGWG